MAGRGTGGRAKPNPVGHGGHLLAGLAGMQLLDSLGIDSAGNVVVGTLVNGGLTVIPPEGDALEHVPLPDVMVTNVCFGGDDLSTAFVTARHRQAGVAAVAPPGARARVLSLTYASGTA